MASAFAFDFAGKGAARTGTGLGVNSSCTTTETGDTGDGNAKPPILEVAVAASGESGGIGTDSSKETDFLRGAGLRIDFGARLVDIEGRRMG